MSKALNKSPLSGYYGGKHRMSNLICSLIPKHNRYVEPFFGGGSVFFLKNSRSQIEYINDNNHFIYNFWKVVKENGHEFYKRIQDMPYMEIQNKRAYRVLKGLEPAKDDIDKAICLFVQTNSGGYGTIKNSLPIQKNKGNEDSKTEKPKHPKAYEEKKKIITNSMLRLKYVYILCKDALSLIDKFKDYKDAFFYLDPPYPETNQGHYKGYSMADFNKLTNLLKTIKGKFLLSCYLKQGMDLDKNWIVKTLKIICKLDKDKKRTEALIRNYA